MKKMSASLITALLLLSQAGLALADAAPVPNKGDTAWVIVSTILVTLMVIPGLALFYGGMVRSKNMLSILLSLIHI